MDHMRVYDDAPPDEEPMTGLISSYPAVTRKMPGDMYGAALWILGISNPNLPRAIAQVDLVLLLMNLANNG